LLQNKRLVREVAFDVRANAFNEIDRAVCFYLVDHIRIVLAH
jgi:hypothetical protein